MKVPILQSNRVAESQGALGYSQTPNNLGEGWNTVARGLSSLGGALTQFDAKAKERAEKTDRFNALTALNDFELENDVTQTELKRQSDPTGKDFAKNTSDLWNKRAEEFISTRIPKDLQEEFRYRLSENRQRVLKDAYDFEYKAGDAWFRKGIDEQLNRARTEIAADPSKLEVWQKKMDEVIDAADLSQIEKDELRDKVHVGMVATEYYETVKKQAMEAEDIGVTNFDDDLGAARGLIKRFESGRSATLRAYADKDTKGNFSAWRIGHGSDTITRADGSHEKVTKDSVVTQEEADADLEYRLQEREGAEVRRQIGTETWAKLPNNVKAALYSIGYNYGNLPREAIITAAREGDFEKLADVVASLPDNNGRRRQEAAVIRGTKSIDLDEKYSAIPFDDRVQMRNAAEREAKQAYTQQQKLLNEEAEVARNDLYTGLFDGTKNNLDIQAARDNGLLTDIDHITKAYNIYEKKNEEIKLTSGFIQDRTNGKPYDPTDEDQKKGYNAAIGPDGIETLSQGNDVAKQYFNQTIKPLYEQTGAMATDVAGLFQGMMRGGSMAHRQFAVDALSQLRDINPVAFASQIPEALQRQVDYWDSRKGFYEDPKELLMNMQGGTTQEERQRRLTLRKDAEQILSKTEDGVPTIENLMQDVLGAFDNSSMFWVPDPQFSSDPVQKQALYREFQVQFVDEYERYGTVEEATEAAIKTIKGTWGVSPVGQGSFLMKYPPNMVGYKPGADGSYNWIDNQVRTELALPPEKTYELVSDDKTRQEWENYRAGGTQPPTYRVIVKDENGVMRDPSDDPTKRTRMYFEKTESFKRADEAAFDLKNEVFNLQTRLTEIIQMKMALDRAKPGEQMPKEILEEEQEIQEKLQTITPSDRAIDNIPEPTMDPMGAPL